MTGYHTPRGRRCRSRSDSSLITCIRAIYEEGYDELREGSVSEDLQGIDAVSTIDGDTYQHKAQFDAGWFNLNIQTREWGAMGGAHFYIWHHVPTDTILIIPKDLVIGAVKHLVTKSNQPFYTINMNQRHFKSGAGWHEDIVVIRNPLKSKQTPSETGAQA